MRKTFLITACLLFSLNVLLSLKAFQGDGPTSTPADERLYVATHVDVIPPHAAAGKELLTQFAVDSRKDPGAVRIEILQDISRSNHFTVVTVWEDRKAFDAHLAAAHTRDFRTKLQPMLGSPFDERLHRLVP
jgi:quinol monooxygenase YgiN